VLVFLPGEREIRDTADVLRQRKVKGELLPLYSRLPAAEQDRVFKPGPRGASCSRPTSPRPRSPCRASAT
jgi:HrpA-like RNA helicase